jgi:hypothetical protein
MESHPVRGVGAGGAYAGSDCLVSFDLKKNQSFPNGVYTFETLGSDDS